MPEPVSQFQSPRSRSLAGPIQVALVLLGLLAFGIIATTLRPVLVPVVLATVITLLVAPVERRIAALLPRGFGWLGLLAAVGLVLLVMALFVAGIWVGLRQIVLSLRDLPALIEEAIGRIDISDDMVFGSEVTDLLRRLGDSTIGFMTRTGTLALNSASSAVLTLAFALFLTVLLLAERPRWQKAIHAIARGRDSRRFEGAVNTIAMRLRRYLVARAALGLLSAILYALWMGVMGMDLLLVWGLLTFLFGFIPNIGATLSSVFPVIYGLATRDPGTVGIMFAGLVLIEQVTGNFINPRIEGQNVSLSPVTVLVSVLVWGYLWGIPGALLAVPIMIAVVVTLANIDWGRPIALLLSNQTTMEGLDQVAFEETAD